MDSNLKNLRQQIDQCDSELIKLLSKRFKITKKVGLLKQHNNLISIDPDREADQFKQIAKLAKQTEVSPQLAQNILRSVIDQVVRDHEKLKHKNQISIVATRPKVGIIGMGAFEQLVHQHLRSICELKCFDSGSGHNCQTLSEVMQCDFVLLAVPLSAMASLLKQIKPFLKPSTVLIDVCSVKLTPIQLYKQLLPRHNNVVFTHPLFGPQSAVNGLAGHTIILCNANSKAAKNVREFCEVSLGLKTVSMSARDHDLMMANFHALTFFVARGLSNFGLKPSNFQAPSFQMLLDLAKLDKSQSQDLFETVECGNIFAKDVRRRLIDELKKLDAILCQD